MLSSEFAELERLADDMNTHPHIRTRIKLLLNRQTEYYSQLSDIMNNSTSQLRQDSFVLSELNFKRNGYFVEFGASNGVTNSNTLLLEKQYGWSGILAEPAKAHHTALFKNRKCHISTDCVYTESNLSMTFNQVSADAELSTLEKYSSSDFWADTRQHGERYQVTTVSLIDLLRKYNAPYQIDYISIDTEGSELDILQSFDFTQYQVKIITCEHNHSAAREQINDFLSSKDYERRYAEFSDFDDWYVLKDSQ